MFLVNSFFLRQPCSNMRFVLENLEGKGKSGGGLTFLRDGVHYLNGILSTKFVSEDEEDKRGMERPRWLFTDVMNDGHLSWLQRHWRDLQVQHGNYTVSLLHTRWSSSSLTIAHF